MSASPPPPDGFLEAVRNLSHYHREHEMYYALQALAERWSTIEPRAQGPPSPFAGAEDLNDERAIELAGILFMEGEGEPGEIGRIKRELRTAAEGKDETGSWLDGAMQAAWGTAELLLGYSELVDLLGERHRIIAADWEAASLARLIARHLERSVAILDRIDFTPKALRADLGGPRNASRYLYCATELIDRAADLTARSASLVHENERRWRVFRERVEAIAAP